MSDILSLDHQSSWEEFQRNERIKELPLLIRTGLRDTYYKPTHPVHTALTSLRNSLGGPAELKIDWSKLWTSVSTSYPSASEFVPSISHVARAFITAIENCIAGGDESWGNALLDRMKAQEKTTLELYLLVDAAIVVPKALYLGQNASVALKVPKAGAATYNSYTYLTLVPQVLGIFEDADRAERGVEPEWVDAGIDGVRVPQLENAFGVRGTVAVERFPDVEAVPRPDLLMEKPPYIATVRSGGGLEVECNHPRTLDLIATYLEKYGSDKPHYGEGMKMWKIERHDSYFGGGLVVDKVTVEEHQSNWGVRPTPMLVLTLLQHTLGYILQYTDGTSWVLKREAKFAGR